MKLSLILCCGVLGASGAAWLLLRGEPAPSLVDASGGALTAGPAPGDFAPTERDPFEDVRALVAERRLEEADARLRELLETDDRDGEACILLSEVNRELRHLEEASDYGRKATELLPESAPAHLALARALGAQAMAELDSLMGLLKAKPRIDRFLEAVERAIELDPRDVEGRKLLVLYHMAPPPIGDPERALELCGEIGERDPAAGKYWYAIVHARQGDEERAYEECREGMEAFPEEPGFPLALGRLLVEDERFEEADEAFRLASEGRAGPEREQAAYERAKLRIEGDFELERAVELLDAYIAAEPRGDFVPSVAHAQWRRGMALEALGRRAEALAAYRESLRLDPELTEADEALAKLGAGE